MGGDLNSLKIEEKYKIYLSMSKESEEICIQLRKVGFWGNTVQTAIDNIVIYCQLIRELRSRAIKNYTFNEWWRDWKLKAIYHNLGSIAGKNTGPTSPLGLCVLKHSELSEREISVGPINAVSATDYITTRIDDCH